MKLLHWVFLSTSSLVSKKYEFSLQSIWHHFISKVTAPSCEIGCYVYSYIMRIWQVMAAQSETPRIIRNPEREQNSTHWSSQFESTGTNAAELWAQNGCTRDVSFFFVSPLQRYLFTIPSFPSEGPAPWTQELPMGGLFTQTGWKVGVRWAIKSVRVRGGQEGSQTYTWYRMSERWKCTSKAL